MIINFEDMVKMETPDRRFTYKQLMQWHYFSKAGLISQWRTMCHAINYEVDRKNLPSGWILAYGSMSDYYYKRIVQLAMAKRVTGVQCRVAIEGMKRDINNGYERLVEATE